MAISNFIRCQIEEDAGRWVKNTPIHVIRNIAPERQGPKDTSISETLKTRKKEFQIVFVGQLAEKKGIHLLVEALIALDDPTVGCWIIGDSLENDALILKLQSSIKASKTRTLIEFTGYLFDPRAHYAQADWHIAPSTYDEPLGNVVQEAQREGTPSIISNRGGLSELVEHQRTGWILDEVTPHCIQQTILHLKQTVTATHTMGCAAKAAFETYGASEFQASWMKAINM